MVLKDEPVEILSTKYGLWDEFVKLYKEKRGPDLWPPQVNALENGALDNKNFLMVSSAGSGKTHIAEIIIFHSVMNKTKPAVYLAPYNALVEQKTDDFKDLFESPQLGLKVSKSTLEDESDDLAKLTKSNIIVMTYEKFDYYLRNYPKFVSSLSCVIIDEFHMIGEVTRGPPLEILVALLKEKFSTVKLVGLSAVIPNSKDISLWLDANICNMGNWRKNPLYEGVYDLTKKSIEFYDQSKNLVTKESVNSYCGDIVCNIIIDFIKKWGSIKNSNKPQVLVFAPKRKYCVDLAEKISEYLSKVEIVRGSMISANVLEEISKKMDSSDGGDNYLIKTLKKTISTSGVAFHHAGLSSKVKRILEKEFEEGNLLVLVSTTTLAAGINLPVKRVIITEPKVGLDDMMVSDYKNLAGRAGRPKYTSEPGECVIVSDRPIFTESYKKNYIFASIEPLESKINLKEHLGIILNLARGYPSVGEIVGILDKSLFGVQKNKQRKDLEIPIDLSLSTLKNMGFLNKNKDQLNLTPFGESVSKQIIHPISAYIIIRNLHKFKDMSADKTLFKDILLSICATPEFNDWERMWSKRNLFSEREKIREELGFTNINRLDDIDKIINTVNVILDWMDEKTYKEIFENNVIDSTYWGTSDIGERIAPIFARTIRTIRIILKESDIKLYETFEEILEHLQYMTLFGVKKEHVPFVKLGIVRSRNTFRNLEKNGINTVDDLITKDIRELSKMIGKDLSISLKRRAIKAKLPKESQEKELLKIHAFSMGIELSLFDRLFETAEKQFELAIEDSMKNLEPFLSVTPFHDQSVSKPEFEGYLKDSKGRTLSTIEGEKFKLCIECKSTTKLTKLVSTDSALEVLKKCPANQYTHKVVIGTPGFEDNAKKSAEEHNILLIPISVYARVLLLAKQNKINELVLATIFSEIGELTEDKLKTIIDKVAKERNVV